MPKKRSHAVPLVRLAACAVALTVGASAAYTVQPGDTLSGIAARFGVKAADLARANAIGDPNHVVAGRTLDVHGGSSVAAAAVAGTHEVAAGEVLAGEQREATLVEREAVDH